MRTFTKVLSFLLVLFLCVFAFPIQQLTSAEAFGEIVSAGICNLSLSNFSVPDDKEQKTDAEQVTKKKTNFKQVKQKKTYAKKKKKTETKAERKLLGNWRLTEYCQKCNSGAPTQTASGNKAQEWWTCAVSYSNYKKLKGCKIYIDGYGEFEVQDWGRNPKTNEEEWVDLFLPEKMHNKLWAKANVYLVYDNN